MKILVRGTNWIGDAVMSLPALKELRRIFPDAQITLHTRTWAEGLFSEAEFIDELVTFDKSKWKAKDVYDNSQFLRDDGYDLAVLLPNSFESALTSFLSKIPRRVGYNKDVRGLLLTDPIAVPEWKGRRHEVYYYLNLISEIERRMIGRDTVSQMLPDVSLKILDDKKAAAREQLRSAGVDVEKRIVALGVGSTNSAIKRWPVERFAKLADRLANELNASVILLGSPDEASTAAEVAEIAQTPVIDISGRTTLPEAIAILAVANLMISNDMGLAHVAAAVGIEVIALFGPTNPETTRPWGENVAVLQRNVACEFCRRNDRTVRHVCAKWVSVDEAFEAAIRMFEREALNTVEPLEIEVCL
ncbi:MAG TPA: lipopolysaccharide heptosyltransferase II [Pyrinomonadaceae bacterium]|jgi:heptosyltransferase-2|nr:lipopolysaccharide heptosyltransferase II [Pyrinomonadaceae bacterium]